MTQARMVRPTGSWLWGGPTSRVRNPSQPLKLKSTDAHICAVYSND